MDVQDELVDEIEAYCRDAGIAETTFGRIVVNDGKFVGRLREGKGVTTATVDRVRRFLTENGAAPGAGSPDPAPPPPAVETAPGGDPKTAFRFYDNRQKYLAFVNTCSEKWVVAERAGMELANIHPQPPALRLFDAGMGDGGVLTGVMRQMHRRFRTLPFYIVGKEISLEDVRLGLERMPDRFLRAPGDRAGDYQPLLHRGAVADAALDGGGGGAQLDRGRARRRFLARIPRADHRAPAEARRNLAGPPLREDRQPALCPPVGAGGLSRGPQIPARPGDPAPRRG